MPRRQGTPGGCPDASRSDGVHGVIVGGILPLAGILVPLQGSVVGPEVIGAVQQANIIGFHQDLLSVDGGGIGISDEVPVTQRISGACQFDWDLYGPIVHLSGEHQLLQVDFRQRTRSDRGIAPARQHPSASPGPGLPVVVHSVPVPVDKGGGGEAEDVFRVRFAEDSS